MDETVRQVLSTAAGIIFFIGFIPYGLAIWRSRHMPDDHPDAAKPSKASWIIWIALDFLTLAGMFFAGTVNGQIIGTVLGGVVILILTLLYGKKGWTALDVFSLAGGSIGIVLWITLDNPVAAIVAAGVTGFLGSLPTFRNAWEKPGNEDRLSWTIFFVSCVCAMLAIPAWTFGDAMQPSVFFAIQTIMVAILYLRPTMLKHQAA